MLQLNSTVNTSLTFTVLDPAGTTGTPPTDLTLLFNGTVVTSPAITVTDLSNKGLYNFTFTPLATGVYVVYAYGSIVAQIDITTRTLTSFLQNIEDEALGSWIWNKTLGTLQLLKQDGTPLGSYNVVDNLTTASRELIS